MKRFYNYTFKLVCIYILVLSLFSISSFEIKIDHYDSNIHNSNKEKIISSTLLAQNQQDSLEEEKESINIVEENTSTEEEKQVIYEPKEEPEQKQEVESITKSEEVINVVDTSSFAVLSQETVNMSHYGHDCYGCTTGYTASGYYVGDGKIYYQDSTFGTVRVVAADRKYPLGTILRLGYHGSNITAIVLDRGGAIGDGKRYQIDLLATSNSQAYELGIVENTSLEVLRLGY